MVMVFLIPGTIIPSGKGTPILSPKGAIQSPGLNKIDPAFELQGLGDKLNPDKVV
jgi:hypothetical protein